MRPGRLPDGGPLRIEVKGRGLDLGRDAHLDWTLPDPSRSISSKHCEIRYRDGEYWLHDRDGDRLSIGPYMIAVSVEGQRAPERSEAANPDLRVPAGGAPADVWSPVGEAAAPEGRDAYRSQRRQEIPPDFLDFAAYLEEAKPSTEPAVPSPRVDD